MAAWIGPASLRNGRRVYVCVPAGVELENRLGDALATIVRPDDRILFASDIADSVDDPVAAYAIAHGHDARSIRDEQVTPDLIIVIVDPIRDSASAVQATSLAPDGRFDLVIAELPDPTS
jgi:hypothetical protein